MRHFLHPPVSTRRLTLSPIVALYISTRSLVAMPYLDSRSVPHMYTMMVTLSLPPPRGVTRLALALPGVIGAGSVDGVGVLLDGVGSTVGVGSGVGAGDGTGLFMKAPLSTARTASTATAMSTMRLAFLGSLLKSANIPIRAMGFTEPLVPAALPEPCPCDGLFCPFLPPDPIGPVPEDSPFCPLTVPCGSERSLLCGLLSLSI